MGGAWGTLITLNLMSWTRVLFSFVEWSIQLWYQPREGGRERGGRWAEIYRKEKNCGSSSWFLSRFHTCGSHSLTLAISRFISPLMPISLSSSVLMKLSRISDIRLVKQKNVSASACSVKKKRKRKGRKGQTSERSPSQGENHCRFRIGGHRTSPIAAGVGGEQIINGPDDLVHALDVTLAGIQLGVNEQNPLDYLPVRLLTRIEDSVVFLGLLDSERYLHVISNASTSIIDR